MSDQTPDDPTVRAMRASSGTSSHGWRQPEFTNWIDEQLSWKETCYLGDWSFLANLRLDGPDAESLLASLSVNSFDGFGVGRGKHVIQCNRDGDILAEGVLMRVDESAFVLHGVPGYWTAFNADRGDHDVSYEFRDTYNLQVQGPNAPALLEDLADTSLADVEFIHFGELEIVGRDVTALRMGMSGELGFELQGPAENAEAVRQAVLDVGEQYGIRRLGARTALINHLEACFPTRGRDYIPAIFDDDFASYRQWLDDRADRDLTTYSIEGSFAGDDLSDWYRTPYDLGWAQSVRFNHEFVGREALETEASDPARTIRTLVWDDADVVDVYASLFGEGTAYKFMDMPHAQRRTMQADAVLQAGEPVGVSTSRGYSAHFRSMLSLCTIDVDAADVGTEVTVVWGEGGDPPSPAIEPHVPKEIGATVAPAPYKEDRRRDPIASERT